MLTVDPDITAADILQRAVDKHCACDCTLLCTTYRLLYPDGQLVEHLPGDSNEPFTLMKYKLFIGKAHQKLVLYLCHDRDYTAGM